MGKVIPSPYLSLADYRRRVFALYADVRTLRDRDPVRAHNRWREERDTLFGRHPQSALDEAQRDRFEGLRYYAYDPAFAFVAPLRPTAERRRTEVSLSAEGTIAFLHVGTVELPIGTLDVFWLDAYGGGIYLPFRDGTAGDTTYGGGRYLLDTVKGADLGATARDDLVLDFNFAYHPSCHYNPAWSCPLAPPGNRLAARVEAGEQRYSGH
jgi:uncharacterized protein (DUF1684 family)